MTDEHVLAHLARRFARSEENIATEALTWVLRRSAVARRAVLRSVGVVVPGLPADLEFAGQVGEVETGRPDVVGTDEHHRERLLIEAKFAAALTEQQPTGYLRRLPQGETGVLLVVAPESRQASLWSELLAALPGDVPAPAPSAALPGELPGVQTAPGHWLLLTSWRRLVHSVLDAVQSAEEHRLARDVEQILSLTEAMDARAFVPVRLGDLGQQVGRQVHQLARIVDTVYRELVGSTAYRSYSRRPSYGRNYYGWYAVSEPAEKRVWFGSWPWAWGEHGVSPLWAQVHVSATWPRHRLQRALAAYDQPGEPGVFELESSIAVPLPLPTLAGERETVRALLSRLTDLSERLAAAVPPGSPAVLDDPVVEDDPTEPAQAPDEPAA